LIFVWAGGRPWGTDNGGGKPALDLHSFVLAKISNDMVGKALHHFIKRQGKNANEYISKTIYVI